MTLKAGARLRCPTCPVEVVVVRAPVLDVELTCGGSPLGPLDDVGPAAQPNGAESIGVALGKRYTDEEGSIELLCTKAGRGPLACDGNELVIRGAKPLPSSD
jgi:hypothetical protein